MTLIAFSSYERQNSNQIAVMWNGNGTEPHKGTIGGIPKMPAYLTILF
jgi:hypothetical protein